MTLLENVRLPLGTATDLPDEAIDLIARMKLELVGLEAFTGTFRPSSPAGCRSARHSPRMALDTEILSSTSRPPGSIRSPLPRWTH